MKARAKDLIGRKIVAVDMRPFHPGRPGVKACDPIITLDNGVKLFFLTQETDVGQFGTLICRTPTPGHEWRTKR